MDKNEARAAAKSAVAALTAKERFSYSGEIADKVMSFVAEKGYKSAFVYMSVKGEPSTFKLIERLQNAGVTVYIPKIAGDNMLVSRIDGDSSFILNRYGIAEICGEGEQFYGADINIIPLVAFDRNLNRVGHGKGFYDKYLINAAGCVCAVAFSASMVDSITAEPHDIRPEFIITEKEIISRCE